MAKRIIAENTGKKILHLLHIIDGVNADIKIGVQREDDLMIRQYQHLKDQYTKELNDLFDKYELKVMAKEAA